MWIEAETEQWYETATQELFKVVAVDNETIEIQYIDGGIEELDWDTWQEMDLQPATEPEDFSGTYGGLGREGFGEEDFERSAADTIEALDMAGDAY